MGSQTPVTELVPIDSNFQQNRQAILGLKAAFVISEALLEIPKADAPNPPVLPPDIYADTDGGDEVDAVNGNHYAWVRLPRWLNHRRITREQTEGTFISLDLCSAFPIYSELMRSIQFRRSAIQAQDLVKDSLGAYAQRSVFRTHESVGKLDGEAWPAVFSEVSNAKKSHRKRLQSSLQEVIYNISEGDLDQPDTEALQKRLQVLILSSLLSNRVAYEPQRDQSSIEGRWQIDFVAEHFPESLVESLATIKTRTERSRNIRRIYGANVPDEFKDSADEFESIGQEAAMSFLVDFSWLASDLIVNHYEVRASKSYSMDSEEPVNLLEAADSSFDTSTKQTGLYHRTKTNLGNGHNHLRQSIFDTWPFDDESLALITCFEGWPMYFGLSANCVDAEVDKYEEQVVELASRAYTKLQKGGRIVIFPWNVIDKGEADEDMLETALGTWEQLGADIAIKPYSRQQLYKWMSSGERDHLVEHSPLFSTGKKIFYLLVVQKPLSELQKISLDTDDNP